MSDSNEHESPLKTPKQLIGAILAAFIIPIFVIVLLAYYVTSGDKPAAGSTAMSGEAIAERIKPVAQLELIDANAPKILKTGEEVYKAVCAGCHATGAAGAPKQGDNSQWASRISQGFDRLLKHALQGFNAMPAKGGNPDLDDIEVARAVAFMANAAGARFTAPEPKADNKSEDSPNDAQAPAESNAAKP